MYYIKYTSHKTTTSALQIFNLINIRLQEEYGRSLMNTQPAMEVI